MLLVIDSWVLHQAARGNTNAIQLLYDIYKKCHKICIDNSNKIMTEYRDVPEGPGGFVSWWLRTISPRKIIKIRIKVRCQNILGHRKDMKFVYVSLNQSSADTIVSEDHHFLNNSDKLLKKGIRLLSLDDALDICQVQS